MLFAILFGLSMDYNVFLLSRIREAYFELLDKPSGAFTLPAKVLAVRGTV
jgi:uncharacterized membrane protein YdfJ with MMPL/SSD domain